MHISSKVITNAFVILEKNPKIFFSHGEKMHDMK
jgi:hypothetical protein